MEPDGVLTVDDENEGSIIGGVIWMFVVSVLLFWLPGIGSLIAGIVGGMKAGGVVNALIATLVPGFVLGIALFVLASALTGLPLLGAIAGTGSFILSLLHVGPLLIGALIGGVLA